MLITSKRSFGKNALQAQSRLHPQGTDVHPPLFSTPDIEAQGNPLNEVAALVDAGRLRSTATDIAGKIDAATLRKVHALIESGSARGKIMLEGF